MALHITADVVLANLTICDIDNNGIDFNDINIFCQKVKEKITKEIKTDDKQPVFTYFEVDEFSVKNKIKHYPDLFCLFKNKIYKKQSFPIDMFNNRYPSTIKNILTSAALETIFSKTEKKKTLK